MNIAYDARGFTCLDLSQIGRTHAEKMVKALWGPAWFVYDRDLEYVAIWGPYATLDQPPMLTISKFRRSSTYAASSGPHILATAKTLDELLRALE